MDTESLIIHIQTKEVCKDIMDDLKHQIMKLEERYHKVKIKT